MRRRAETAVLYGAPILICLAIHWLAIKTWFRQDDFAWLGLLLEVRTYHDWLNVLFSPRAQGTIRTIGERLYFLGFSWAFGLNALPFRIWVFLTQFANLVLLASVTRRLTGSKVAAGLAPVLWSANLALAIPLNWSSAYNEICCAFFLLLAFYFLLLAIETGRRRYWVFQWIAFLLGFGALELIVVYPAIVALYTWIFARRYFRPALWLFIPSLLFTAFHFLLVPANTGPVYGMHFNWGIFPVLWLYWAQSIAALRPEQIDWRPLWLGLALAFANTLAIIAFALRRPKLALFCLGWFLAVLLPVLPLTGHFSEYYAAIPSIGLAMLGACAVAWYPRAALPLVALYLVVSISDIRVTDRYFYREARAAKRLVLGLEKHRPDYQGKSVLLSGIDNETFWLSAADNPFHLIGIENVYLTPESEKRIDPHPELGGIGKFVISPETALSALEAHRAEVYQVGADGVRDITSSYTASAEARYVSGHPEQVDVGSPLYAGRLGAGWYRIENGFRWMGRQATLRLGTPGAPGQSIDLAGFAPSNIMGRGPVTLTVLAAGRKLGAAKLKPPGGPFDVSFPLPSDEDGHGDLQITLEVDHTSRASGDERPLGLIFGTIRIK